MAFTAEIKGCALHFRLEGAGEPVVWIQGVGLHGDGWLPQTEQLRGHWNCLTFDSRGMAQSHPAGVTLTVAQMAEDTLAIMDAAGIDDAHIVGHSLGGVIAQQIALTAKRRVKSLSLLCTSARGADGTRLTWPMLWLGLRSRVGTRQMRRRAFLEIVMPADYLAIQDRDALAERLRPIFGHDLGDSPPIVMQQLSALKRFDGTARLGELAAIPTLVLSAAGDLMFPPECGRKLAAGIPGAKYLEVPGAAHGVPIQCAAAVNRALLEHIDAVTSVT